MATPPLNRDEQAKVDALAELKEAQRRREYVNPHLLESGEREADLARFNAQCRQEHLAPLERDRQARVVEESAAK